MWTNLIRFKASFSKHGPLSTEFEQSSTVVTEVGWKQHSMTTL